MSDSDLESMQRLLVLHLSELEMQNALPNPLLSKKQQQQRSMDQWMEVLTKQTHHFHAALQQMASLKEQLSSIERQTIEDGMALISNLDMGLQSPIPLDGPWEFHPIYKLQSALTMVHFQAFFAVLQLLLKQESWADALSVLILLSCLFPKQSKVWFSLGRVQQRLGDFQEAISAYTQANHLLPSHPLPVLLLADCHLCLGAFAEADLYLQHCALLIEQHPEGAIYESRLQAMRKKRENSG